MSDMDLGEELTMDPAQLYREDVFTDRRVGTIRQMIPVLPDGSVDPARQSQFIGSAQILTPAGALPLTFELVADDLAGAVAAYPEGAKQALEKTMEELREMQREAASSIVVPKAGGGMPGGGGLGGGGMPGGGLQIP